MMHVGYLLVIKELYPDPLLQHCAQTLLDFNGGASCVQVYVNQHDFFINRVQKKMDNDDSTLFVFAQLQCYRCQVLTHS